MEEERERVADLRRYLSTAWTVLEAIYSDEEIISQFSSPCQFSSPRASLHFISRFISFASLPLSVALELTLSLPSLRSSLRLELGMRWNCCLCRSRRLLCEEDQRDLVRSFPHRTRTFLPFFFPLFENPITDQPVMFSDHRECLLRTCIRPRLVTRANEDDLDATVSILII